MREGQRRINVYIPDDLYSRVLNSEYNLTEAIIKGLTDLLEPDREGIEDKSDTNTQEDQNSLNNKLIQSLENHIKSLESQIMVKDEQLRTQAVHLQTVLTQKYITPPSNKEKPAQKQEHTHAQKKEDMPAQKAATSAQKTAKTLIEKTCKNCQQTFFTENPRKETCSSKCRSAYSRKTR
ncbi:MAG: hypothetical protein Q8910_10920 [Bacteroidota bacterium]|nr:hypothetical protein [Bacteroidota bacterium]